MTDDTLAEEPNLVAQEFSEDELNNMNAQFQVLVPKLLTACNGTEARVAAAALISSAANVIYQGCKDEHEAAKYMMMCVHDALLAMKRAYDERNRNGSNDPRKSSEGGNKKVAH